MSRSQNITELLIEGVTPSFLWERCANDRERTASVAALALNEESLDSWLIAARSVVPSSNADALNSLAVECEQRSKPLTQKISRKLLSFDTSGFDDVILRFVLHHAQMQAARSLAPNLPAYRMASQIIRQRLATDARIAKVDSVIADYARSLGLPLWDTDESFHPTTADHSPVPIENSDAIEAFGFFESNDVTEDGVFCLDALLLDVVASIDAGAVGGFRSKMRARESGDLFRLWKRAPDGGPSQWRVLIAKLVWDGIVCPRIEKSKSNDRAPFRMATTISRTIAFGRLHPIKRDESESTVLVEPPKGIALSLPFDRTTVSKKGSVVTLRQVFSNHHMKTYLALLIAWFDGEMQADGSFFIDGPNTVLELTGAKRYTQRTNGKTYNRFASNDMREVREHLELFKQIRVRSVGDVEVVGEGADALVQEIREVSTKRRVAMQHSRLIARHLQRDYLQIPRAIARLEPADVSLGVGMATVIRKRAVGALKADSAVEAPIGEWLEACGINARVGVRRDGPAAFWENAVANLSRVAREGALGAFAINGQGDKAVASVTLSPDLKTAYERLVDASERHERANERALTLSKAASRRKT